MVAVVFLDLRKAFDTVNHLLLLNELCSIGCSALSLRWFESYLTGRTQTARVGTRNSGVEPITCGVPQGSVLGPLLFIVYINSVVKVLQHSSYFMYADDLAIAVSHTDPYMVKTLLQADLDAVSSWCDTFRLTVNSDKTHVLWCYSEFDHRNLSAYDVILKGKVLKVVPKFNYLGVLIDSHISFEAHCNKVISSGNVKLKHLRRLKKYMDESLALLMYKQMILPALDYCDFILESASDTLTESLQTIQNHCLRCCLNIFDPG